MVVFVATNVCSTVQMRLYTMSKRRFAVVSLLLVLALGSVVLVSIFGPAVLTTQLIDASELLAVVNGTANGGTANGNQGVDNVAGPYLWVSPELSVFAANLWMSVRFELDVPSGISVTRRVGVTARIFGVSHAAVRRIAMYRGRSNADALALGELGKLVSASSQKETNAQQGTTNDGYRNDGWYTTTREVHCATSVCDAIPLVHIAPLNAPHMAILVRFELGDVATTSLWQQHQQQQSQQLQSQQQHEQQRVVAAHFMMNTNAAAFTQSAIAIRAAFALAAFVTLVRQRST